HRVPDRPDQGDPVHDGGAAGQALADRQPRHPAGGGSELPAHLGRGGRLHVEGVVLAGPAPLVQEDDGPGPRLALAGRRGRKQARGAEAGQAEGADLEEVTAGEGRHFAFSFRFWTSRTSSFSFPATLAQAMSSDPSDILMWVPST